MERIKIERTANTPSVLFDGDLGILKIEGRSIHENSREFFAELIEGVESYQRDHQKSLWVTFDLEYYNTATARELINLLKKLREIECVINWVYEEGDIESLEDGQDYEALTRPLKFKFIEKAE